MPTLEDVRVAARAEFEKASLPSSRSEVWRRTDPKAWRLSDLTEGAVLPAEISLELPRELADRGVWFGSLEEAAARFPDRLLRILSEGGEPEFAKWELANRAFGGGAFLHLPKGTRSDAVLRVVVRHPAGSHSFPRIIVCAEEGVEASVLEEHQGDGAAISAAFSQVEAGAGSSLRIFYIQKLGPRAVHFWHQRCSLGPEAVLEHFSVALGARTAKSRLDVDLKGTGARSGLFGISFASGAQQFDPYTGQRHGAPRTSSDLLFRAVLKDKARSSYTGLIRIEQGAAGCEAYQANHNLLLSGTARADTTPVLEILNDEVRCKHGATAGPLPAEEFFYLNCRGIPEGEAQKMLVMGFFEPVLGRLPEAVRDRLVQDVESRLDGAGSGG